MDIKNVKKHPLYSILVSTIGEKKAIKVITEKLEEERLQNQAVVSASAEVKSIVIPVAMTKLEAATELKRQWDDEENQIQVSRQFEGWHWKDFLVAVKKVSEAHFGWIRGKTKKSFFSEKKPAEIDIVTDIIDGKKQTEICFYGYFSVSPWEDAEVEVRQDFISTTCKKRYANEVREFYDKIQNHLEHKSIYRGKSITVVYDETPWGRELSFEIFEMKKNDTIVLNDDVEGIVENFVIDALGEQGKRCYLFSGGYGNGKTETAMRIGIEGKKAGMAFFYCKDAEAFHELLATAIHYQPCIVFLEDVDEIGAGEERDADMNRILNTLDGVQTKGNNLTVMFTTNHENRINPALRRPGRIDLVINFGNPDKKAVSEIYRRYLEVYDTKKELDYETLALYTPDAPGAVVAEIAKRAVRLIEKKGECDIKYIQAASDSMKHHIKLMSEPVEKQETGQMLIAVSGGKIIQKSVDTEETIHSFFLQE